MSDSTPPPPAPPPQRSGCLTALMILIGAVLLLPGICALAFVSHSMLVDPLGLLILLVCLAIGVGGIALIWAALRRPGS
jgi:hypothetical protein